MGQLPILDHGNKILEFEADRGRAPRAVADACHIERVKRSRQGVLNPIIHHRNNFVRSFPRRPVVWFKAEAVLFVSHGVAFSFRFRSGFRCYRGPLASFRWSLRFDQTERSFYIRILRLSTTVTTTK